MQQAGHTPGLAVSHAILRKTMFRRLYVIDIETHDKYPSVDGYSAGDDGAPEIYLSGSEHTLHYGEEDQEPDPGLPGLTILEVHLPKILRLPSWLDRRPEWHRPEWRVATSVTDKYTVQLVAWYGRY